MSNKINLANERRARLAAERILQIKQAELYSVNCNLSQRTKDLNQEIDQTRAKINNVLDENLRVKTDLSAANQRIRIAERRLHHSLNTIRDGFAVFDSDSKLVFANAAYLSIFDNLEEVREGVSYFQLLKLLADEGIVDTGKLTRSEWCQKLWERWKSGVLAPIVIRLWNDQYVKLIDRRGVGGDITSLGLNITEAIRQQNDLKNARVNAEAANRAKSAFLANISDEIRTPMNGIVSMAELLMDTGLSKEQKLFARTMKNSGEALLVIINDVLDYSKIEANKISLIEHPFDLKKYLNEIILVLKSSAKSKNLTLTLNYPPDLPSHFLGDPGRIRQIMTNLIGNAVKFTPKGSVTITVSQHGSDDETPEMILEVTDTGVGIAEEKITHIFDEFNQGDNEKSRQFEGTGLGLSICKRLVDLMGGEITVRSTEGKGSSFTVNLKLPHMPQDRLKHPNVDLLPSKITEDILTSGDQKQLGILAAEDNKTNQLIFKKMLKSFDVKLKFAANGEEAIALFEKFSPDFMFMDNSMPKMDGKEATHQIRTFEKEGQRPRTPIIALTAHAMPDDKAEILGYGIDDYLTKPLKRTDLIKVISKFGTKTKET